MKDYRAILGEKINQANISDRSLELAIHQLVFSHTEKEIEDTLKNFMPELTKEPQ